MRLSNGVSVATLVALALLAPAASHAQIDPGLSVAAGNSWQARPMSPVTVDPMAPVTFAPLEPTTTP